MKKVLFVLLLTSFLAACGDSSSTEEESNNRAEEENNDSQTEEVASETSNEEPVADTQKKLGLKTEDIFHAELFEDQEESLQSYDYENMKIDVVDNDPFRIFVYYIDDSEYASGLVLRNNGNNKDLSQETFDFFYNDMDESIQNASRQFKRADGDNYLIGVIFNGEIDIDNPPIDLSEISGKDFF